MTCRFAPNLQTAQDSKTLALKIISQYQAGPKQPQKKVGPQKYSLWSHVRSDPRLLHAYKNDDSLQQEHATGFDLQIPNSIKVSSYAHETLGVVLQGE